MNMRSALSGLVNRIVGRLVQAGDQALRERHTVDLALSAALRQSDALAKCHDPVGFVELVRRCIQWTSFSLTEIKHASSSDDAAALRFTTLLEVLRSGAPAIEFATATEIALIADGYACMREPVEYEHWCGDVGLHFALSSSLGRKGRLLSSIVRFCRRQHCLELGTGYGMSALFVLAALEANGVTGHLSTLESCEPQFSLASSVLKRRYPDRVSCHFGTTQNSLPLIVNDMAGVDFLFHDAGHSREDYVRDFATVSHKLVSGAIVLFDDIRWEDSRFYRGPSRCYEGWLEIAHHRRVARAVEIDDSLGMLLLT